MKKLAVLGFALGLFTAVNAQDTATKYDADEEMQEQMRLMVNKLGLDQQATYDLGQIMVKKREEKEKALAEIEQLKQWLTTLEENAEKEYKSILTPAQWEKYQAEVKAEVKAVAQKHEETIDK